MNKIVNNTLKVLLTLISITPIFGALGVFPAPTADMYTNEKAFAFISIMMSSHYINVTMAIVFAAVIFCIWSKRTALAALLLLPLTVNIVGFHLFLDGGLFNPGAIMADILLFLNIYFLWQQKAEYASLLVCKK